MFGRKSPSDAQARLDAIGRSQAMIEFNLDGSIITANQNYLDALGYRLDEIQGKHHSMFVPADQRDTAQYKAFCAALNRGEYQAREFKRIAKGGREVWIEASYNPVLDGSGKAVLVAKIATEITAKKIRSMTDASKIAAIGRFAVVASEVKSLANQAKQATDKIGAEIGSLNGISGDVVSALGSIKQGVTSVSEYVTSTVAAVEEQSTVTNEMSNSMQRAAAEAAAIAARA
ncbi:PAS domain S-box protein [Bradyrhizobium symbiodeficiens]|uniref:PAS domain-containing protein n=1 Tax=Bradyrhizobium symbiodeficiens TaxID=1404367 RepID=UPI003BB15C0C